jgi:signal transduction histidine kinase
MTHLASARQHDRLTGFSLWAATAAAILIFGLCGATVSYLSRQAVGIQPRSWSRQVVLELAFWLTYLPLFVPALRLAKRLRFDPANWQVRTVLVHVVGAILFSLAHSFLIGAAGYATGSNPSVWSSFMILLANFFLVDFCLYWGILAAVHAFDFYRESVERSLTAARLRADLTEARLRALRTQLTPHFLFNTLNCLSTLSLSGDGPALRTTLANLGTLLRFSLDDQCPQEVSLRRDLDLLDQYVDLQRLQFGDRLSFRRDIDPATLEALVPSFLLQPLVENAIVHGYSPIDGARRITIRAAREGETLHLSVADTGPGWPANGGPSRRGVGLENTIGRLQNLYGSSSGVSFGNASEGGAVVTLSLPLHFNPVNAIPEGTRGDSYAYR